MAHGTTFTWSWLIIGVAALAGGLVTGLGQQRPMLGALWIVLGLLNIWGAWRHRALSRGNEPPRP